jgi:polyisoprenyl-phosphate glycosyltransferase
MSENIKESTRMPLISVVVPVYNEEAAIHANLATILKEAAGTWYELELIAIDDGSSDASALEIHRAAEADPRIRLLSLTRNFGKEAAIHAGLAHVHGEAAIVLDGDLQHPPTLIPRMLEFWRQGLYVVDAVKSDRGSEARHSGLLATAFYRTFQRFSGLDIEGHCDFKLLDRVVVDAYLAFPEKQRFFRGLIGWANYPSAQIPFSVPDRAGDGGSRWSKLKLLRYAIYNISSFSSLPLRLVSLLGLIILAFGAVIAFMSLARKIRGEAMDGFTTVNLLIIIIGGAILVSLGIIGHYIARLYDEVKGRPPYLIKPTKKTPP